MVYTEFANYWYYFSITTCIYHQPWEVGRGTLYLCNKTFARFYLCWAKDTFIRRHRSSFLFWSDMVHLETTYDGIQRQFETKVDVNSSGCFCSVLFFKISLFILLLCFECPSVYEGYALFWWYCTASAFRGNTVPSVQRRLFRPFWFVTLKIGSHAIKMYWLHLARFYTLASKNDQPWSVTNSVFSFFVVSFDFCFSVFFFLFL